MAAAIEAIRLCEMKGYENGTRNLYQMRILSEDVSRKKRHVASCVGRVAENKR